MKSKLEKSIEYIKGYCIKHTNCDNCKLKIQKTGYCKLEDKMPCDWDTKECEEE